jgi:hypothetical protein
VHDALAEAIRTRHPDLRGTELRQRVVELLDLGSGLTTATR